MVAIYYYLVYGFINYINVFIIFGFLWFQFNQTFTLVSWIQ